MKISKKIEWGMFILLYISLLYLWSLPFQKEQLPYGDVDSGTHFTIADYMGHTGKTFVYLPKYLNKTYYTRINSGKLWYMPHFHLNAAIFQIIGGQRIIPIYLYFIIACSTIVIASFFLMKKLYGFLPAFSLALLLTFSTRDIMWYLWGQYPQVMSFGLIPLVIYCYYKNVTSLLDGNYNKLYLLFLSIFLAMQFFIHPQALLVSLLFIIIYSVFVIIKERKLPVKIKHLFLPILIAIIILAPFLKILVIGGEKNVYKYSPEFNFDVGGLFKWYPPYAPGGVSPSYYSYKSMHGGYWTIPFLVIGLILMLIRRKHKDLVLLSLFIAFYLVVHQPIILFGRVERFIEIEALAIYPIVITGFFYLGSIFRNKKLIKYILFGLLIVLIINFNGKGAYVYLNNAYEGIMRINNAQYDTSVWIRDNLPEDSSIFLIDSYTKIYNSHAKRKWIRVLSQRHTDWCFDCNSFDDFLNNKTEINQSSINDYSYLIIDYSDLAVFANSDQDNQKFWQYQIYIINEWEKSHMINSRVLFNKDYTKVYKIE